MSGERFRVLGLAPARADWFREVSRWATSAALPVDFVKCVALDELAARLTSGRVYSALLIDARVTGLDRDLVDQARELGAAAIVVDDGHTRRDWVGLGVDAVLPSLFERGQLLNVLVDTARPVDSPDTEAGTVEALAATGWPGRLVAVTGSPGGGSSTMAMAVAQGLTRTSESVVLADLALHGDLALLHDAGDVVPGLQEVVEAYRTGSPSADDVYGLTFISHERGYHLVLGLRRHRDWTALRPRAVEATVGGLMRAFDVVVTDSDPDLEGDDQVGSSDVEDRNLLARTVAARADLVLVVATPSLTGLRRLVTTLDEFSRFGVSADRIQPVLNRAPRRSRVRAQLTAAVAELLQPMGRDLRDLASPVFVPERPGLDHLHQAASPLPRALVDPITKVVVARLAQQALIAPGIDAFEPVAVVPGSLGSWAADDEEMAG